MLKSVWLPIKVSIELISYKANVPQQLLRVLPEEDWHVELTTMSQIKPASLHVFLEPKGYINKSFRILIFSIGRFYGPDTVFVASGVKLHLILLNNSTDVYSTQQKSL